MRNDRRQFLLGGGTAALLAGAGSVPILLTPTPARAWVVAAISVAQAGYQLYQMSRSGGGGIGKLLAAQTEMLRAISAQIRVISDTLNQVYENVVDIKEMLTVMPDAVTTAGFRGQIRGAVVWSGQILETVEQRRNEAGREASIADYKDQAQAALNGIRQPVGALSLEQSLVNVPIVCLAWYTEMQLMTNAVAFDPLQVKTVAGGYRTALDRWLPAIRAELAAIDQQATDLLQQVRVAEVQNGREAYTDLGSRIEESCAGHQCDGSKVQGRIWGQHHKVFAAPEPVDQNEQIFLREVNALNAMGAPVSPALMSLAPPKWTDQASGYAFNGKVYYNSSGAPDQAAELRRVQRLSWPLAGTPGAFVAAENQRIVQVERLRQRAVMHYHFLLAATEARRSVEAVITKLA